jgi:hypothetical protein
MYEHDYPGDDAHEFTTTIGDVEVRVSKVGGGTVGRDYEGAWHYLLTSGVIVHRGSDFSSGQAVSHSEAAALVVGFLVDEDGEVAHAGHFSRLGGTWWCDTCNSPYCERA